MIYLIIYLIGVIILYYYCRYLKKKQDDWTYSMWIMTVFTSIFSWFGIVGMIIVELTEKLPKVDWDKEPPKWL